MRACPACGGPKRTGTCAKALYRCQRGIEIGHVCVACLARSIPVVLNVAIPAEVLASEFAKKGTERKLSPMTQAIVDGATCGKPVRILENDREVALESCFMPPGHLPPCKGLGKR